MQNNKYTRYRFSHIIIHKRRVTNRHDAQHRNSNIRHPIRPPIPRDVDRLQRVTTTANIRHRSLKRPERHHDHHLNRFTRPIRNYRSRLHIIRLHTFNRHPNSKINHSSSDSRRSLSDRRHHRPSLLVAPSVTIVSSTISPDRSHRYVSIPDTGTLPITKSVTTDTVRSLTADTTASK